jgi:hypothetical protein
VGVAASVCSSLVLSPVIILTPFGQIN